MANIRLSTASGVIGVGSEVEAVESEVEWLEIEGEAVEIEAGALDVVIYAETAVAMVASLIWCSECVSDVR